MGAMLAAVALLVALPARADDAPAKPDLFPAYRFGYVAGDPSLEPIEQLAQCVGAHCRSRPVSNRNASRYFSRVRRTTSSGRVGKGGCLFQRIDSR